MNLKKKQDFSIHRNKDESLDRAISRILLSPEAHFFNALSSSSKNDISKVCELNEVTKELRLQIQKVQSGDLGRAEEMLVAQAHSLDRIFNELIIRVSLNMGEYMNAFELYLKLALKTQSQCKSTWEAVSHIQNPSSVRADQINLAQNQQINNHQNPPTELSGINDELCKDP